MTHIIISCSCSMLLWHSYFATFICRPISNSKAYCTWGLMDVHKFDRYFYDIFTKWMLDKIWFQVEYQLTMDCLSYKEQYQDALSNTILQWSWTPNRLLRKEAILRITIYIFKKLLLKLDKIWKCLDYNTK